MSIGGLMNSHLYCLKITWSLAVNYYVKDTVHNVELMPSADQVIQLITLLLFTINLDQIKSMTTEVITTNSGKVRGLIQPSSLSGIHVQKFLNIPYAEAPVDDLRFEKPRPRKPWNGTLNSTEVNIACLQEEEGPGWNLTEDCLILNVWTPHPRPENASVMVYIYGGSFRSSSSGERRHNGANIVAVGDVILVTLNYRVSALGFLSTGDERLKGNLGLFDQRLAMKWVKENIQYFGGNPEAITLFGLSAGAVSVSAHTLSPESWPYFNRVILQSGNMLMPWALPTEAQRKAGVEAFLNSVNCTNDEYVLKCLKNVTHDVLEKLYTTKPFALDKLWYLPTVDGDFFKHHPKNLIASGSVKNSNIILGVTKDEMFYAYDELLQKTRDIDDITKVFKDLLRTYFKVKELYEAALKTYTPECTPTFIEALRPIVDSASDVSFTCPTRSEAILRSKIFTDTKVYLYRYSYATPVPNSAYPRGQFGFAAHGADFTTAWGIPINKPGYPPEDQILSIRIILYWTNFAKTGDPNSGTTKLPLVLQNNDSLPTWPRHTSSKQEYLDMESLSQMVVKTKLREKYCNFLLDPAAHVSKASSTASRKIAHLLLLGLALLYNIL